METNRDVIFQAQLRRIEETGALEKFEATAEALANLSGYDEEDRISARHQIFLIKEEALKTVKDKAEETIRLASETDVQKRIGTGLDFQARHIDDLEKALLDMNKVREENEVLKLQLTSLQAMERADESISAITTSEVERLQDEIKTLKQQALSSQSIIRNLMESLSAVVKQKAQDELDFNQRLAEAERTLSVYHRTDIDSARQTIRFYDEKLVGTSEINMQLMAKMTEAAERERQLTEEKDKLSQEFERAKGDWLEKSCTLLAKCKKSEESLRMIIAEKEKSITGLLKEKRAASAHSFSSVPGCDFVNTKRNVSVTAHEP